ncbi:aminotransferase class V-fold PLP-dependent enzyme [Mucilaginibacter sp. BJC16-A38]|uniref:aminotransferase class V-fold PLP-dependent enzyme n=1 Tax=Mucilaginibacter phenanthrenivorans TaxID=1234842 RepID=UPI002158156A|nr:aminotransferase class V-fold PLP-dependent enzyme [Mucilaginibacter phenanthrenivorans]MCR8557786.1 aminotransferase class V-fold PLP-dependent enzyme [Mucilaginibacter phenanthrenivorans]
MSVKTALEDYFAVYRENTIGYGATFDSPFGRKELVYADWTASGRAYRPIEETLLNELMPFWANTHTSTTVTGTLMSKAYEEAKKIIKQHVNASDDDVLIFCGSGMTDAVNKLQRLLGLRMPERTRDYLCNGNELLIDEDLRPVVFVTHMEHHSNHVSWLETIATVEIINSTADGYVDLDHFADLLDQYKQRKNKIAAITACSNVTGIQTPYHQIAKLIHRYNGLCFVDFACSAPYVEMDMHPAEEGAQLDAVYFSMHKFLGGPGTPGVLIFNSKLYHNKVPDQPGGGTISYSNPWEAREYVTDIEVREDGGTPPLLQGIKAAMCIRLKEQMGAENIQQREKEMLQLIFSRFATMERLELLQGNIEDRLAVFSFVVKGAHHHLIAQMLNDRFGIQTRSGCSCAGTYGHALLKVGQEESYEILDAIRAGDLLSKPGWVRFSVHPMMTNHEIDFIMDAIEQTSLNFMEWMRDYACDSANDGYRHKWASLPQQDKIEEWFGSRNVHLIDDFST